MITAWDIYWVMQLDSIGALLFALAMISGGTALALSVWTAMHACDDAYSWNESKTEARKAFRAELLRRANQAACVAVVMFVAATAVPSTKTAAAMIVLPALSDIASSETVQHEAGELYGIAKDALRELARPKPEKADK